jgi:acylphosphatase
MAHKRAHLIIQGRVQGVSFRYYTLRRAEELGVCGWVRNLWDGRVEAVVEGESPDVEAMVAWCRQGPPAARVADVQLTWREAQGNLDGFRVLSSASDPEL